MKVICLIDMSAVMCRFGYALKDYKNERNFPIGALYGMFNILINCIKILKANNIVVVKEGKNNYKKQIYVKYKCHRKHIDDFILQQFDFFLELVSILNINLFFKDQFEADDIIASLAWQIYVRKQYEKIYIITFDKDLFQMLDLKNVLIAKPTMKNFVIINKKEFEQKKQVSVESYASFLALCGDASDNIPGIAGIGEVSARQILKNGKTLYDIYANVNTISCKFRKKIIDNKKKVFKFLTLTTLNRYIEFDFSEIEKILLFYSKDYNIEKLLDNLFTIMNFLF